MTETSPKITPGEGVLYSDSDYAGLFRRFVIVVADAAVVFLVWMPLEYLWYEVLDPFGDPYEQFIWSWVGFSYVYLAVLKRSPVRTLGFWLTGVRIVNYKGTAPSLIRMTFRLCPVGVGSWTNQSAH